MLAATQPRILSPVATQLARLQRLNLRFLFPDYSTHVLYKTH